MRSFRLHHACSSGQWGARLAGPRAAASRQQQHWQGVRAADIQGSPAAGLQSSEAYKDLCDAVAAQGGFIHPALVHLPGGGITAAADVRRPKGSLVELPLGMRLTSEAAQELLLPALNAAGLPTVSLLDESQQIALALAWLRNQQGNAADPRWQAYIQILGPQNPAGWAKPPAQLAADHAAFLDLLGLDLHWWQYFVAQVQEQVVAEALALTARYGRALGVSAADVLWGLGQVAARKVAIDNQVMLEPWSDLLRHPPLTAAAAAAEDAASRASSTRCELSWTYGLCRKGVGVVSRGSGVRVANPQHDQQQAAAVGSKAGAAAGDASSQQQQEQSGEEPLLLAAGEELWAASDGGQLFSSAVVEQGHMAPLTWYLQHGTMPAAFAAVNMRTSDLLDSWRQTVSPSAANGSSSSSNSGSSSSGSAEQQRPTVLWDYLTQQYQQDVLTVLAATPVQHQQDLLQWLMQPVTPAVAAAAAGSAAAGTDGSAAVSSVLGGGGAVVADVDPVAMIGVLDELLLAAIDAADDEAGDAS